MPRAVLILSFVMLAPAFALEGTPKPETNSIKPELTEADRVALDRLFEKLESAFNANKLEAIAETIFPSGEKVRILEALKRELAGVEYSQLQIEKAEPDYRIGAHRLSVDVTLRYKLHYRDDNRPLVENHTIQTFIVHQRPSGEFAVVSSSLFDNMGKRGGWSQVFWTGLWTVIVVCLALGFWVWMGSVMWMARPRSSVWRVAAFIPGGVLVFLLVRYLPARWKRK